MNPIKDPYNAQICPCLAEFDFFFMVYDRKCEDMLVLHSK